MCAFVCSWLGRESGRPKFNIRCLPQSFHLFQLCGMHVCLCMFTCVWHTVCRYVHVCGGSKFTQVSSLIALHLYLSRRGLSLENLELTDLPSLAMQLALGILSLPPEQLLYLPGFDVASRALTCRSSCSHKRFIH